MALSVGETHRQATVASLSEVARSLQELLTRRLTAYIAGVKDGKTVTRWATGEVTEIRDFEVEQRLRTAYELALMLLGAHSPQAVRSWFIGLDPRLGDTTPADALREGRLADALASARSFLAGDIPGPSPAMIELEDLLRHYPEVARVGHAVYQPEGLRVLLIRPSARFGGASGLELLRQGRADEVISVLAADYEGIS